MRYFVVRSCDNGKGVNKVHLMWFEFYYQADKVCKQLNKSDVHKGEEWIVMSVPQYKE